MPQLWTETFVTQYFWLVVIILGFYYIAITEIIPQIAFTLKIRKELEIPSTSEKLNKDSITSLNSSFINGKFSLLPVKKEASSSEGKKVITELKTKFTSIQSSFISLNS